MKNLLRWAGSKTKLLGTISPMIPKHYNYYEPFFGTGQVLLNKPRGVTIGYEYASDSCVELMDFHAAAKHEPRTLLDSLAQHESGKEYYLAIRAKDRSEDYANWNQIEKASRFFYLNQTCFNGLYRVNKKGYFNVPYGDRNFTFSESLILQHHQDLRKVELKAEGYLKALSSAVESDFVYLDPPYAPTSKGCFVDYSKCGFGLQDYIYLAECCHGLDRRGVKFLMSNSDTPLVRAFWGQYNIKTVETYRSISANPSSRGKVTELLISNY